LIPGLGRPSGGGNGHPLQYSCLENPMDRGAWWATAHGVARVRCDLGTKPPSPLKHHFHCYSLECRLFHFVSTNLCTLKAGRRTGIVFAFHFCSRSSFQLTYILLTLFRPIRLFPPRSQFDSVGPSQ